MAVVLAMRAASHVANVAAVKDSRVTKLKRRLLGLEKKKFRRLSKETAYMKLLFLVLLGHVCLISLGIADLVKVLSDNFDDILLAFRSVRSHTQMCLRV